MVSIDRDPPSAAQAKYDLIVVGGGIYGACLALEAARRDLSCLLLEKHDFGGATSGNSLRIIHGGLRYLQNADLRRFRRSVQEQAWWLKHFPLLVQPLPCLMPLYDRGLHRTDIMRVALQMNDWLAKPIRQRVLGRANGLDSSSILSIDETKARFAACDLVGLRGAARWSDAVMTSPPRLLIEVLRWAVSASAIALNYMECQQVVQHAGRVVGVRAKCQVSNREFEFRSDKVINCAGPWAEELVDRTPGAGIPRFRGWSQAFNVVLCKTPVSEDALALCPPRKHAPTYFLTPFHDQMLLGTVHLPLKVTSFEKSIADLIADLNLAIPGLSFSTSDVTDVLSGQLPAAHVGGMHTSKKYRIISHHHCGGPDGLTTVIGVKYTTARFVAEEVLKQVFSRGKRWRGDYNTSLQPTPSLRPSLSEELSPELACELQHWFHCESVTHIDDFLLRRAELPPQTNAERTNLAQRIMQLVGWDEVRQAAELRRLGD